MSYLFNSVSIVGLGYIGLPTAAVIASHKVQVAGVDINPSVTDLINQGKIHIVEPDLEQLVKSVVQEGYLSASTEAHSADVFIISVPTPFKGEHTPDLSYVRSACETIAPVLKQGDLVILESTSPVGTTEKVSDWLAANRSDLKFPQYDRDVPDVFIAHCPERVLPGRIIRELVDNDRVIGGLTPSCSEKAAAFYQIFVKGECILTDARTAEMTKLTENAFRDVNIAYANELSLLCDKFNVDVWELISLANRHPRVNILSPGPGFGGHCIAVDPWFLVSAAPDDARLIRCAREVNDSKPFWVMEQVKSACLDIAIQENRPISEVCVACFGLTFKADIDDLRQSPSLRIVEELDREGEYQLLAVEPHCDVVPNTLKNTTLVSSEQALEAADVCVLLVDHSEFKQLPITGIKSKAVVDLKGIWKAVS
ncbi:UDP-N-acetyl-D-mannosamine dehydrogenase [Algicola sagamiensis]|uniref:UDP-N-acetyl-D-mannosamine dehydrogenase n=1 Tax=Algicola sagamiensis TaxID=163869 RepID=UPI0003731D1A|nr:UDP-N-acetyl-D-mannosamine dehydrogenase [Algicola sagamiensis]